MYLGDIRLGDTLYFHFSTRQFSTGASFLLAGSPVISAYPQDSTTEITSGITLTANFDSRAGLNSVKVIASSGNGYATATNYSLVITTGTVDSVSVVGEVIGTFSIEARSALMPTTAARTLDVTAAGEAGIDWNNIGAPTTVQNLSGTSTKAVEPTVAGRTLDISAGGEAGLDWNNVGTPGATVGLSATTIKTATDVATAIATVQTDTDDIQTRLPAALVSGRMDSSVGAYQTGLVPLQPTTAGRTLDVTATGEAGIDWNNIGTPSATVGLSGTTIKTATDIETDTQDIQARLPAALTGAGNIKADALVVSDKTDYSIGIGGIDSPSFVGGAIDAAALATSAGQEIADRILLRGLQTGADGPRTVQDSLRANRNRVETTVGGDYNVYEEDDTSLAWTGTVTRTAGVNPITEIEPS